MAQRCVQGIGTSLATAKSHGCETAQAGVRTLPDGVTAAVPDAWSPGDSLASTDESDAEVVAAGELAKCEAVAKKRKRPAIDPDVKDWFLDYHECMKVKHKWNMMQSWRRAQEMLPSLLKYVHEATFEKWTHSDCKVPKHIHFVYIPAQSTSYCQPCGMAMFKTWKSVLADAASESLPESVVGGQNIKTTFDFSLMPPEE